MPSPFPGMDPYLEGPRWQVVHANLVGEIARQLAPLLRPKYVAFVGERVVIDVPAEYEPARKDSRFPDVAVVETGRSSGGTLAVIEAAPLQVATRVPEKIPHFTVEIRDTVRERLVTAIEVLSATNKRGGGRKEYLKRRRRYLGSDTHLIEIDLFGAAAGCQPWKPCRTCRISFFSAASSASPSWTCGRSG